jgi:hypothetical protein
MEHSSTIVNGTNYESSWFYSQIFLKHTLPILDSYFERAHVRCNYLNSLKFIWIARSYINSLILIAKI